MRCAEDGAILRGSDKTPAPRTSGRAQNRDGFPIVPPIDAEVFLVHRDHRVVGDCSIRRIRPVSAMALVLARILYGRKDPVGR